MGVATYLKGSSCEGSWPPSSALPANRHIRGSASTPGHLLVVSAAAGRSLVVPDCVLTLFPLYFSARAVNLPSVSLASLRLVPFINVSSHVR